MINEHIELGVINTLKINRITEPGIYLEALDEEVVLLPNAYVTKDMQVEDELEVFVYTDSEDRLVSTTQKPYGMKNEFMFTRVVDVVDFGAFVDWGLQKDLFVPRNRQKTPFRDGQTRIVRIVEDEESGRLIGVEKITSYLSSETKELTQNQIVDLLVFAKTPMGYKAIVDDTYEGMVYNNEIFTTIDVGDKIKGYVKTIRDDGKVDISLQPIGKTFTDDINTQKIITILKQNHGNLPYNYKTDSEVVKEMFNMSKKAYKRALTKLIEDNMITLDENGMELI